MTRRTRRRDDANADVAQLVEQLIRNSIQNVPILGHFLLKPDQTGSNQIKSCTLLQSANLIIPTQNDCKYLQGANPKSICKQYYFEVWNKEALELFLRPSSVWRRRSSQAILIQACRVMPISRQSASIFLSSSRGKSIFTRCFATGGPEKYKELSQFFSILDINVKNRLPAKPMIRYWSGSSDRRSST